MKPSQTEKSSENCVQEFSSLFESLWQATAPEELHVYLAEATRRFLHSRAAAVLQKAPTGTWRRLARTGRFSLPVKKLEAFFQRSLLDNRPLWPEENNGNGAHTGFSYAFVPLGPDLVLSIQFHKNAAPVLLQRQLLLHGAQIFRGVLARLETEREQQRRLSELHILNRVSGMLNQSLSLEEFFDRLYQETRTLFPCETHFLCTYDEAQKLVRLELFVDETLVVRKKVFRLEELGFLRHVIENKVPLLVPDLAAHLRNQGVQPVKFGKRKNSMSWAGIPLLDDGHVLGAIAFASYTQKIDWEGHLSFLLSLGQIVTSALKHLQNNEKLAVSQQKYSTLFRELPAAAALVTPGGTILETSREFDRQIRPLLGEKKRNILSLVQSKTCRSRLSHNLKNGVACDERFRLKRKRGFDRTFHLTASPFSFGDALPRSMLIILDEQTLTFRRQEMLLSLYKMTFEIQQARTKLKILKTAVTSLKKLGFHSFILMYDAERHVFRLSPHSFSREDIAPFLKYGAVNFNGQKDSIEIDEKTFHALWQSVQSLEIIYRESARDYLIHHYPERLSSAIIPIFEKLGIQSTLAVPIHFRRNVLGTLVVLGEFASKDEFAIFQNLATAMAIALERASALQELELSRRKYQTTLERAGMALWVTDADGKILEMNKAARKLLGREPHRWLGRPISELWGQPVVWHVNLASRRRAEKRFGEVELKGEKNRGIPVFLMASSFQIEDSVFIEWIAWDLRKQKRREGEIARRNKELETLYRVGSQINRSHSIEQLCGNVVAEIASLFGVDAAGIYLLGPDNQLYLETEVGTSPEYNREIRTLQIGEGLAGWIAQNRQPLQVADIRRDGRVIREVVLKEGFVSYAGVPILYGKKLQGTLGLLTRVQRVFEETEIKLLQTVANELAIAIENVRLNERLEEASRRYRHLFHEAVDGMALISFSDCQIVEVNRFMAEKLSLPAQKLVGQNFLNFVVEADQKRVKNFLTALVGQKKRQNLRIQLKGKDNRTFAADIVGGVLNLSGKPFAMLMIRDVTRQIELEEQLRLNQQLAAVGELSAGIAHEIRNPLSAINTSVGMLKTNARLSGDDQELLRIISEESMRLEKVVSEFIQFARPQEPVLGRYKLSRLVSDIVRIFQNSQSPSVRIQFDPLHDPGSFWFDANRIRQILVNLIKNALDAVQKARQEQACITISLDKRHVNGQPFAEIVVRDNGPGVAPEKQNQIFQPFFSTKPDGLGMGLSISRKIVEQHGGQLYLEPNYSQGAAFHLLLPLKKQHWASVRGIL